MKAYTAQVLVDLYDKIPYTEALQGSTNLNPKFDDGYSIYQDLIKNLDDALSKDFSASTNTILTGTKDSTADVLFGGNINQWKRFANTLELKMFLRMTNAKPTEAQAGVQKLYSAGASFLDVDAGIFKFTNTEAQDNPMYEQNIRKLNTPDNLRASTTLTSWLKANRDPRITSFFGSATAGSIHQGDYNGVDDVGNTYRTAATFVEKPTDPVVLLSKAESFFLQAEARERYFSGSQAKSLYDAGILASFTALGLKDTAASFTASGGAYAYPSSGALEQKIEAIIVQKWASFVYGVHFLEGFFERNRTGYPKTGAVYSLNEGYVRGQFVSSTSCFLGSGQFHKRMPFPDSAVLTESSTPSLVSRSTRVRWSM